MNFISFSPFPVLITDRLILRRLRMTDAPGIMRIRSDKRVNEFLDRPVSIDIGQAKKFVEKIEESISGNKSMYWAITLKDTDTLIGTICFWNFVVEKRQGEIGYELHPDFQGKGFMQEAFTAVINFGFTTLKLKTIIGMTKIGNLRSEKLLIRNGFQMDENYEFISKGDAGDLFVYYRN